MKINFSKYGKLQLNPKKGHTLKTLKITNLITEYYDDFTREINKYYLDTQTGEIIIIDSMLQSQWEDEGEIKKEDLAQWQQESYDEMMAVFNDVDEERYHGIPSVDVGESANIMRKFIHTVQNEKIADELFETLQGPKSFRRFRAVLNKYYEVRNNYHNFKEKCYLESLEEWLKEIGIKPEWVD